MSEPVVFPGRVALLTCGIDCQARYTVGLTVGWTRDGEAFVGDFWQTELGTREGGVEAAIEEAHDFEYYRELNGQRERLAINTLGVDSGFASEHVVAAILRERARRRCVAFATKGDGRRDESEPIVLVAHDRPSGRAGKFRPLLINTNHAKAELSDSLLVAKPGPRYWHIPRRVGQTFVQQLTSETPVPRFDPDGVQVGVSWKLKRPSLRNEALDCAVICLALWSRVHGRTWDRLEAPRDGLRARPQLLVENWSGV